MNYIDCLRQMGYLVMAPGNKLVPANSFLITHYCNETNKNEEIKFINEFHNMVSFVHFKDNQLDTPKISIYKNINGNEEPIFREIL